jgi:hypothetical protein
LKAAKPICVEAEPPGMGRVLENELLAVMPWANSVEKAMKAADREGKLVLAVVRADYTDRTNFNEQMILAAVLSEPDVRRRVLSRFVPVRVVYPR